MPAGYWCPVLHAHLPYVRHPEHPSFLEEDWSWAIERAASHAGNFLFNRQKQVEHLAGSTGHVPIVVSPYDGELLLAQSSDWAFIMKTNTTVEYAKKRTRDHVARFDYLYRALSGQCRLEEPILREFDRVYR